MLTQITTWVAIIGVVAYIFVLVLTPIFTQKTISQLGEKLLPFTVAKSHLLFPTLLICLLVLCLPPFNPKAPILDTIISICAILGTHSVCKDRTYGAEAGLYQKALVINGQVILLDSIDSVVDSDRFPIAQSVALEKPLVITVRTKAGAQATLTFEIKEEYDACRSLLKQLVPEKA